MFNKNFQFILRRLKRQKIHTASHIIGLTIGIAVCIVIGLFLQYELSFDDYHKNADRIYRLNQVWEEPNGYLDYDYSTPAPLAEALLTEIPSLEEIVSVYPQGEILIEVTPNKKYLQEGILLTEASFLEVFTVEVVQGNVYEALRQPWQTVLTETTAQKFFGQENPIGKTLQFDGDKTLTVAGVIKDFPTHTHLPASMLVSYFLEEDYLGFNPNSWMMTYGASTYVIPKEGTQIASLETSIKAIYDKNFNEKYGELETASAVLQPLSKIHFESQYANGGKWVKAISTKWLWFFGFIGIVVMILASINFVNLSTAQSLSRAKEVGVRKAIGATRGQLIGQFIGEALFLICVSTVLAIGIAYFILPYINTTLDKDIALTSMLTVVGMLSLFGFIVLTTLLTGLYPAWLISKFQAATALQSNKETGSGQSSWLRKILITTQFSISGAMLIALIFVSQQMRFFYQKNLGFDKENIISFDIPDKSKTDVFSNQLLQIEGVKNYSFNSSTPSAMQRNGTIMHETDYMAEDRKDVELLFADEQYPVLFDLKLIEGRFYENSDTNAISATLASDQRFPKVLVNEQLIKKMGFGTPQEALNKRFKIGWNGWQPEIVGVVEDFVTSSLHEEIDPIIIFQAPSFLNQVSLKFQANTDIATTLNEVRTAWEANFPDQIYQYEFLDEKIEAYYESENLLFSFFKIFAGLALLISCIGLWGLATHTALQRSKEIGIRKVLGASVNSVIGLLAKDFIKLVVVALLIAIPVTWYFVQKWLENFAYHISIQWWVFALAGLIAIFIAFLTVSFQSVKVALANPVESLRNE